MPDALIASNAFADFHAGMSALAGRLPMTHTMVGFNYRDGAILSTKFYYVFRGLLPAGEPCPVPALAADYAALAGAADPGYLEALLRPGAGLTFAIKCDASGNLTRGFFFRVAADNRALVENICSTHAELGLDRGCFEDGYGQYVLSGPQGITRSRYVYLRAVDRLAAAGQLHDIDFARAGSVEIAAADQPDRRCHKFIAFGLDDLAGPAFHAQVPREIRAAFAGRQFRYCCPAIVPATGQCSLYVIGTPLASGGFACSPVHVLVTRSREQA